MFSPCRNSLIECESGSDVVFLVGCEPDVQRIPGHSWILAENSPVFRLVPVASFDFISLAYFAILGIGRQESRNLVFVLHSLFV